MIRQWRSFIFPLFNVLLNGFNFFFHIAASWYLNPQQYGQANALLALFALLSVLGLSVQLVAAKLISQNRTGSGFPGGVLISAIVSAAAMLVLFTANPLISAALQVGDKPLFLLYATVSIHMMVSLFRGMMQGKERLLALNVNFYIEVIGKMAAFFICARLGLQLWHLMLALSAGMLLSLIHGAAVEKASFRSIYVPLGRMPWRSLGKEWGSTLLMNVFLLFFTSVDMLAVQHYLAADAGIYAIALKYSQLVYFVSFSVIMVLVPRLGAHAENAAALRRISLIFGVFMIGAAVFVYIGSVWLFPQSIPLLFGPAYQPAEHFLKLGGTVYWLFSIILFFVHLHVLTGRRQFMLWLTAGAVLLLLLFAAWHRTPDNILLAQLAVYGLLAVGFTADTVLRFRRTKEETFYDQYPQELR